MKFYLSLQEEENEKVVAVYEEWMQEGDPLDHEYEIWTYHVSYSCGSLKKYFAPERFYMTKGRLVSGYALISEEEASSIVPWFMETLRDMRPDEMNPVKGARPMPYKGNPFSRRDRVAFYTVENDIHGKPMASLLREDGWSETICSPDNHGRFWERVLDHEQIVTHLRARGYQDIHVLSQEDFRRKSAERHAAALEITVEEWNAL